METDDRLSILVNHSDGVAVLTLSGEIDSFNSNCLRESVAAVCELGVPILLDMSLVTFIDSSGVSALIALCGVANGLSSSVRIARPSAQVRRVVSLTGLDDMLLDRADPAG